MEAHAPFFRGDGGLARTGLCLLGTTKAGTSACSIAEGFGAVSAVLSAAMAVLLFAGSGSPGATLLDALLALAGTALWAVAAVVLRHTGRNAHAAGLPGAAHRQWVMTLCWANVALFSAAFLASLARTWLKTRDADGGDWGLPTKAPAPAPAPRAHGQGSALVAANPFMYAPKSGFDGYTGVSPYAKPQPAARYAPAPATGVPVSYAATQPAARAAQPVVHSVRTVQPPQLQQYPGTPQQQLPQQQQAQQPYFTKDFGLGPDTYWGVAAARY